METIGKAEWWGFSQLMCTAPGTDWETWNQTEDVPTLQTAGTVDTTTGSRGSLSLLMKLNRHRTTGWYTLCIILYALVVTVLHTISVDFFQISLSVSEVLF